MKTFVELLSELNEARMVATGDYRISSSGRKVRRLIKVGDDDYSKADDVDGDGDNDENDEKAKKMRGESLEQVEEATVKKQDYSWGKMMTIHHGADHSYPLHPEHQEAIKKLKDGEKTSFKDETNTKVTAHREGGDVHFTSNRTAKKTTVSHSHFNESVNKSDIPAYLRKKSGDQLTTKDLDKERTQHRSHPETIKKINGTDVKEAKDLDDACWKGYKAIGLKTKNGKKVPNCVPEETSVEESSDTDNIPFDGPYKKVDKEVTTDKSGAKHSPMSKARHLARMALAQQKKKKQG